MIKRRTILTLLAAVCIEPAVAQDVQRSGTQAVKPVVLGESHYDGGWGPQPHDFTTRKQAYWALLSGAAGHAYGADGMYGWADPQWGVSMQAAMNYTSAAQMKHVSDLFTARQWHRLVPDISGAVMTGGAGTGVDYAAAARTMDGSLLIAYVPTARTITINMNKLSGPVTLRWFDPTNGKYAAVGAPLANSGSRNFMTPGNNAIGHTDWILVLETSGARTTAPIRRPSFPLKVSSNRRHFVDSNDRPFFYQADTPWWMIWKGRQPDIRTYLDNRRARGFNTLQVMILPAGTAPAGNVVNAPNINGNRPFRDDKVLDVASVSEAYMEHADQVIRQATDAGFYLVLAPAWFGSKGEDYERYINDENASAWGRYLADHYKGHQNIAWIMAGDSNAVGKTNAVRTMATAFKAIAPHQLVTAHAEVRSSSEQYKTEGWLDFNMAYDYTWGAGWVYPQVQRDYMGQ